MSNVTARRELRIVEIATGRVVKRVDVSGLSGTAVYTLECRLRQEIDMEAYRLEDTAQRRPNLRAESSLD